MHFFLLKCIQIGILTLVYTVCNVLNIFHGLIRLLYICFFIEETIKFFVLLWANTVEIQLITQIDRKLLASRASRGLAK